jgi:Xaa-Pro aminopeptidase
MQNIETYIKRRLRLMESMEPDSVLFLFSAPPARKSNDVFHPFRQDSDFFYFTGFDEESAALVITGESTTLFLRDKNPEQETWGGLRLGVDSAVERLGVSEAHNIDKFQDKVQAILKNRKTIYHRFGYDPKRDALLLESAAELLKRTRNGEFGPTRIIHLSALTHEMRIIKSAEEIEQIRECALITKEAHESAMSAARAGMVEYELEAELLRVFKRHGGTDAYPSIVAAGENACILHYIRNDSPLRDGDLVLIDAAAERGLLNADVTRTFPVNGRFNPEQKALYEIVLAAQRGAIARMTTAHTMDDAHDEAVRIIAQGLIDLRFVSGSLDEVLENKLYRKYFMHRTGHWLGMDVHDVGAYHIGDAPRRLVAGMVATVEPGLYIPVDDDRAPPPFRGIGIRIEDDVLIREGSPEVLTEFIPKEISAIESFMNR